MSQHHTSGKPWNACPVRRFVFAFDRLQPSAAMCIDLPDVPAWHITRNRYGNPAIRNRAGDVVYTAYSGKADWPLEQGRVLLYLARVMEDAGGPLDAVYALRDAGIYRMTLGTMDLTVVEARVRRGLVRSGLLPMNWTGR